MDATSSFSSLRFVDSNDFGRLFGFLILTEFNSLNDKLDLSIYEMSNYSDFSIIVDNEGTTKIGYW